MRKILLLVTGLALGIVAPGLQATNESRWQIGAGYAVLESRAHTSRVEFNGNPLPDVNMLVDDERASLLWVRRRLGNEWAVSTALGKPIRVDTHLQQGLTGQTIPALPIKAAPLMLTVHYAPEALRFSGIQPYVGAGAVYVLVEPGEFHAEFREFSQQTLGQKPRSFDMDNPWHGLWELGVDYRISDHWLLNARALGFKGSSRAKLKFDGGSAMELNIGYSPRIYSLSLEYRY